MDSYSILLYNIRFQGEQVYVDYKGYPDMDFEKGVVMASIHSGSRDDMHSNEATGIYKGKFYRIDQESGHIVVITEDDIKSAK